MKPRNIEIDLKQSTNFLPLGRALMNQAKFRLLLSIIFNVLAALITLGSIFIPKDADKSWDFAASIASGLSVLIAFFFLRKYELKYDLASEVKRFALLENGLGWKIPNKIYRDINAKAGQRATSQALKIDMSEYYASKKSVGYGRLLDDLKESAFFTYNLYGMMRDYLAIGGVALILIVLIVGWSYLVSPATEDSRILIGRLIIVFVPTLLSVGIVSWFLKMIDLTGSIKSIWEEAENLPRAEPNEVMRLVSEYNCRIAQGLPIPGFLHEREKERLTKLWEGKKRG